MSDFKTYLGLGIAGNFALHLAQAGELEDFKDIITEDEAAPKGIFPFYLPCTKKENTKRPRDILFTYPLSEREIKLPQEKVNVQAEPEVGLVCDVVYENDKLKAITPKAFGAYNDCSIREAGREKISDKKNWGEASKGLASKLLDIDTFSKGGIMDSYSICSFLRRNEELHAYGEDVELNGYSYFYGKLTEWIVNQINTQEDFGPLEDVKSYIKACSNPSKLIISIGATRYTPYGESTFLQSGDELIVVLYNHNQESIESLTQDIKAKAYHKEGRSILVQKVL
jgi:hypothetical protein